MAKAAVVPAVSAVVPQTSSALVDPGEILTIDEVADRLKVSKRWVYEKTRSRCLNPLPAIRVGRYLRFLWGDLSAWLRSQSSGGAA
jgi:excisionase family DNA binding protein